MHLAPPDSRRLVCGPGTLATRSAQRPPLRAVPGAAQKLLPYTGTEQRLCCDCGTCSRVPGGTQDGPKTSGLWVSQQQFRSHTVAEAERRVV